jgi:hypothetical protein
MKRFALAAIPAVILLGCGGGAAPTPAPGGIGTDVANTVSDTALMKDVQGAANELVRNAQDCDAVKAALPEVNRKLDEASKAVRTATGQTTLAAIKSRVTSIAQACP